MPEPRVHIAVCASSLSDVCGSGSTSGNRALSSARPEGRPPAPEPAAEWYRRAIFYEVAVRSFAASTGSGTGDLRGLIQQMTYNAGRVDGAAGFRDAQIAEDPEVGADYRVGLLDGRIAAFHLIKELRGILGVEGSLFDGPDDLTGS